MRNAALGRLGLIVIFLGLIIGCDANKGPAYQPGPTTITTLTFNVLCSFCNTTEFDPWNERVDYFTDIIERHDPDLIGFQEFFLTAEVDQVAELNPAYTCPSFTDPAGPVLNEYPDAFLCYKTARFDLLDHGYYWLSDTPDVAWSTGWADSNLWRLVAWAHLRQRITGLELYFASTHVDNNEPNERMSAPLILERTEPWSDQMPAIVLGDFNSPPDSPAYAILSQGVAGDGSGYHFVNSYDVAAATAVVHNQPSEPSYNPDHRIDHIFVAGPWEWSCDQWQVDLFTYGELSRYPSDHYAVSATLTFE